MNSEELIDKLVLWIRDTALAAGCGGTVVGMSSGIDSSVLAVLCHRACGRSALGQTDEDELGLSYEELDRYLVGDQAGNKFRQKIEAMMARSQHKRQLPLLPDF